MRVTIDCEARSLKKADCGRAQTIGALPSSSAMQLSVTWFGLGDTSPAIVTDGDSGQSRLSVFQLLECKLV